jgi:hypothetical protein
MRNGGRRSAALWKPDQKEYAMDDTEGADAPMTELEALVADLSASGPVVFVFGTGWLTAHLHGQTRPLFRGPSERRRCQVGQDEPESGMKIDVRLDQIKRVRFIRTAKPIQSFAGEESLVVRFEAASEQPVLECYLQDCDEGQYLTPYRLRAWEQLRQRYGGRYESLVVDGSLRPVTAH